MRAVAGEASAGFAVCVAIGLVEALTIIGKVHLLLASRRWLRYKILII